MTSPDTKAKEPLVFWLLALTPPQAEARLPLLQKLLFREFRLPSLALPPLLPLALVEQSLSVTRKKHEHDLPRLPRSLAGTALGGWHWDRASGELSWDLTPLEPNAAPHVKRASGGDPDSGPVPDSGPGPEPEWRDFLQDFQEKNPEWQAQEQLTAPRPFTLWPFTLQGFQQGLLLSRHVGPEVFSRISEAYPRPQDLLDSKSPGPPLGRLKRLYPQILKLVFEDPADPWAAVSWSLPPG